WPRRDRSPPLRARRAEALAARPRRDRARRRARTHARAGRRRRAAGGPRGGSRGGGRLPRLADEVGRKPAEVPPWDARPDEHAVGPVDPLVDRGAQLVEPREGAALVVRDQEPHGLESLGEALRDALTQGFQTLAGARRDLKRSRKPR